MGVGGREVEGGLEEWSVWRGWWRGVGGAAGVCEGWENEWKRGWGPGGGDRQQNTKSVDLWEQKQPFSQKQS